MLRMKCRMGLLNCEGNVSLWIQVMILVWKAALASLAIFCTFSALYSLSSEKPILCLLTTSWNVCLPKTDPRMCFT